MIANGGSSVSEAFGGALIDCSGSSPLVFSFYLPLGICQSCGASCF